MGRELDHGSVRHAPLWLLVVALVATSASVWLWHASMDSDYSPLAVILMVPLVFARPPLALVGPPSGKATALAHLLAAFGLAWVASLFWWLAGDTGGAEATVAAIMAVAVTGASGAGYLDAAAILWGRGARAPWHLLAHRRAHRRAAALKLALAPLEVAAEPSSRGLRLRIDGSLPVWTDGRRIALWTDSAGLYRAGFTSVSSGELRGAGLDRPARFERVDGAGWLWCGSVADAAALARRMVASPVPDADEEQGWLHGDAPGCLALETRASGVAWRVDADGVVVDSGDGRTRFSSARPLTLEIERGPGRHGAQVARLRLRQLDQDEHWQSAALACPMTRVTRAVEDLPERVDEVAPMVDPVAFRALWNHLWWLSDLSGSRPPRVRDLPLGTELVERVEKTMVSHAFELPRKRAITSLSMPVATLGRVIGGFGFLITCGLASSMLFGHAIVDHGGRVASVATALAVFGGLMAACGHWRGAGRAQDRMLDDLLGLHERLPPLEKAAEISRSRVSLWSAIGGSPIEVAVTSSGIETQASARVVRYWAGGVEFEETLRIRLATRDKRAATIGLDAIEAIAGYLDVLGAPYERRETTRGANLTLVERTQRRGLASAWCRLYEPLRLALMPQLASAPRGQRAPSLVGLSPPPSRWDGRFRLGVALGSAALPVLVFLSIPVVDASGGRAGAVAVDAGLVDALEACPEGRAGKASTLRELACIRALGPAHLDLQQTVEQDLGGVIVQPGLIAPEHLLLVECDADEGDGACSRCVQLGSWLDGIDESAHEGWVSALERRARPAWYQWRESADSGWSWTAWRRDEQVELVGSCALGDRGRRYLDRVYRLDVLVIGEGI